MVAFQKNTKTVLHIAPFPAQSALYRDIFEFHTANPIPGGYRCIALPLGDCSCRPADLIMFFWSISLYILYLFRAQFTILHIHHIIKAKGLLRYIIFIKLARLFKRKIIYQYHESDPNKRGIAEYNNRGLSRYLIRQAECLIGKGRSNDTIGEGKYRLIIEDDFSALIHIFKSNKARLSGYLRQLASCYDQMLDES